MGEGALTPRQVAVLRLLPGGGLARINLFCGSVRSGKTWGSLLLWALWAATRPLGAAPLLMVGKTRETLRRNCLDVLRGLVGAHFQPLPGGERALLFGRPLLLMGAADARAEAKLRGLTLGGAYCDEVSLLPEEFFAMLLSRLSAPGAKLFATTNPEHPGHWLKRQYLDRAVALDLRVEEFLLEDNTFLEPSYVENLKKEYTGAFYQRYILGRWVAAEGAVYPLFADGREGFMWPGAGGGGVPPSHASHILSPTFGRDTPAASPCNMSQGEGQEGRGAKGHRQPQAESHTTSLRCVRGGAVIPHGPGEGAPGAPLLSSRCSEVAVCGLAGLLRKPDSALKGPKVDALLRTVPPAPDDMPPPPFDFIQVGIDFGGSKSAFAFVACGIRHDFAALYALASRRVPALGVDPEAMYHHIEDFLEFVTHTFGPVRLVYADSAEQTLINGLRRRLAVPVRGSLKHPILQRVRAVNLLLAQRRLWLTPHCQTLADALQNALFAPGKTHDERLDNGSTDIDSLDAFEYAFERYLGAYTRTIAEARKEPPYDF